MYRINTLARRRASEHAGLSASRLKRGRVSGGRPDSGPSAASSLKPFTLHVACSSFRTLTKSTMEEPPASRRGLLNIWPKVQEKSCHSLTGVNER
jgi:hypothetical protein